MSAAANAPVDTLSDAVLLPIYGTERLKSIRAFLKEFDQYKSNFPAQVPLLREAAGRKLLLLQCPITISRPTGPLGVTLGLLFTTQFPEHPPHCAILLQPNEKLCQNHPIVAANGVIRLPQLPFLQGSLHPTLCDILVAVTDAFEASFPLEGAPVAPPPPQPQQPRHTHSPPPPKYTDPMRPPPSSSGSPTVRPQERELAEKVLLDLRLRGEQHLRFRKEALSHYTKLKASREALEKEHEFLVDRKQTLLTTAPEMNRVALMVREWKEHSAMPSANSCITPVDDLHAQAMELIAQNHAADDVMELLEKKLKKGFISCEDYLKMVSDIARKQFIARLLLKWTYARISAEANARTLARRFPNFDPKMVSEVLKSSDYEMREAESRLQELAS